MPGKVIGCIQVKGGAGRSTLATNLAGEFSKAFKTAIVDCDMPQGTSAAWGTLRAQAGLSESLTVQTAANHKELVAQIEELKSSHDCVILDAPPRIAELTRAIFIASDLSLIPVGASVAEIWATSDLLPILKEARALRRVNARLVWTRFRAYTKLAQELSEQASGELGGIKALDSTLGFRVAYPDALGQGLTVAELRDPAAKEELTALVAEVAELAGIRMHKRH